MVENKKEIFGAMILPDGKYYSLNDRETRLNNNVLVVGTTGSAKTRTVITPNLLECIGSYVVTDPKGNLYRRWGGHLENQGYRVVRLSFIHPEQSVHYNPIKYVKTTQQIQQLSNILINRQPTCKTDPFWDDTSMMLINSLIAYLVEHEQYAENRNFHMILELLRKTGRKNMGREAKSVMGDMMEELHMMNPSSWAYKQYKNVDAAPEKTFNTIVATSIAKFCSMDTEELAELMKYDEIDLPSIGQRKTAVFVEVSDSDRSMDPLINLFFTQTMNQLCTYADEECENSRLPVPVRFFMDDFSTNCKIDNFENMISNIRSRKISVILAIQSLSQLTEGYGTSAHTIIDDCDTLVYMGGNDTTTAREIAIKANRTTQSILQMPLCNSWIFRRGEKPFMCRNMELDDYLEQMELV